VQGDAQKGTDMNNLQNLTQDIINAVINADVEMDVMLQASRNRQLERIEKSRESFETAINMLASNNVGDRYVEVEKDGEVRLQRKVGKASANRNELWNGKIDYCMYKSDIDKYLPKQDKPTATIKAIKRLPKVHDFKGFVDSSKEFKPSLKATSTYKVLNYRFYNKAIVLEVADVEKERTAYQNRELVEKNSENIHLVFRYEPLTRTGKPNPYDGITQLRNFLHSQKFIVAQKPATVKEALDLLVGYTVDFPQIYSYNSTTKSDYLTVYSVFGDFSELDEQFSESKQEYQKISDYYLIDKDCFGYETIKPEVYQKQSTKYNPIISYDCHKEFTQQLPLAYSHIGYIFD
jgi:hypothetical protein